MNYAAIPSIINTSVCLGLAIFVFTRNPKRLANLGFALGMASLALTEFGHFMVVLTQDPLHLFFWKKMAIVGEALLPGSYLLFSLTFARADAQKTLFRWWPSLAAFYLVPLGLLGFLESPAFLAPYPPPPTPYLLIGTVGYAFYVLLLLGLVVILMNLEQTLRATSGSARWQIKYMILSIGAILSYEIYEAGQVLLFSAVRLDILPIRSLVLLMACALMTFALIRHRLLDVDVFISRYVIYNSVTLLAAGIYLTLVGLTVFGLQRFGGEAYLPFIPLLVFVSLLAMVVFLLSDQLRRKVKTFINIHFYKNKHDYRLKWQEFTQAVGTKLTLTELLPSLTAWLTDTLGAKEALLWLWNPTQRIYYPASPSRFASAPSHWSEHSRLVQFLKERASPVEVDGIKADLIRDPVVQQHLEFLYSGGISVFVPMLFGQDMVGFVAIGRKITGDPYHDHDLELLSTIADQAAGQIHRVRVSEELAVAREMEAFHTLSSFFVHDLKNVTSSLSLLVQNAMVHQDNPEFQRDAFSTLQETVLKMNQLIRRASEFPRGLQLSRAEVDLNRLIAETVIHLSGAAERNIIQKLEELPRIPLDAEQILRVFQNLLINACEATSQKGLIIITTWVQDGFVYIAVSDNGCGMSEEFIQDRLFKPFQTTKSKGLGIGLFQCKKIIEAHEGKIEVQSEKGKGSTFTVLLPIEGNSL